MMPIMINYNFGDILLVPFPFTNQLSSKKRPAVVISSLPYNSAKPDLIIMPVTSQIKPTQELGEFRVSNWEKAGLLKPSAIKPVITTIEKHLILKQLGQLQEADQYSLCEIIKIIIG